MTDEEKKQLVEAVITQLKSEGTDVSNADIVSNANGIDYVVAYGKKGQIVRAVPTAISSEKVGASGYMNAYTEAGVYNINTSGGEDLPIDSQGAISARLTVLVTESGGNKVITQVLNLNNNAGGEGNVYIRSCQNGEWRAWGKLQTNVEVGQVNTLDNLIDNGIYSGVFTDGTPTSVGTFYDTFVLIVINNYAVSIPTGNPQSISQLKYSLGLDGSISVASRKRDQYGYWDNWASLDEKSLVEEEKSRAEQAEKAINDKLDDEIERSVAADQDLLRSIDEETRRATEAEEAIKNKAVEADSLNFQPRANVVALDYKTIEGVGDEITIPAATTESAGIMSAEDKKALDNVPNTIEAAISEESKVTDEKIATEKTRAEAVEQTLANDIANAPNLALRALFIAAGAEYNDSGADKTKTAPWGETVTHKAGHYYLNGLGDITEEEMATIYLAKPMTSLDSTCLWMYSKFRTNLSQFLPDEPHNLRKFLTTNLKIQVVNNDREIVCSNIASMFGNCVNLHTICPILNFNKIASVGSTYYAFDNTPKLVRVKVKNLKYNITFYSSPLLDKESVLYLIQNAAQTSAITITLHADTYARLNPDLEENADIKSALEAQPLITLASA